MRNVPYSKVPPPYSYPRNVHEGQKSEPKSFFFFFFIHRVVGLFCCVRLPLSFLLVALIDTGTVHGTLPLSKHNLKKGEGTRKWV